MESLPPEILIYIASYLNGKSLLLICQICGYFNKIFMNNLSALLREYLYSATKFNLDRYDRQQLIKMSRFDFDNDTIAAGYNHSLILTKENQVYIVNHTYRMTSTNSYLLDIENPMLLRDVNNIKQVSTNTHSLLLDVDTNVYGMGSNNFGQLGLGDNIARDAPTLLPATNIIKVSIGTYHSLIVTNDGYVYAFGYNAIGRLGLGDIINKNIPT